MVLLHVDVSLHLKLKSKSEFEVKSESRLYFVVICGAFTVDVSLRLLDVSLVLLHVDVSVHLKLNLKVNLLQVHCYFYLLKKIGTFMIWMLHN